ncbi:MAG: glycosyltransferase family 2 protein [Candidatus Lambdaproteobacteria bacterium]|nr:glycosyltransferase family 2 protein [Candidatus Lambdaproteobacteria bacterium]
MASIAFSLIGHNEAHVLPRAFASIAWADEIIYVDCESRDESLEVARKYTPNVFARPNTTNFNVNKSYGIAQATADWVFYLDPDEVIPPALAEEIRRLIESDPVENAFTLPRRNLFFGRWLAHGGQYPDRQLRLFRRGKAYFPCKHVHETLVVEGRIGRLREAMEHHTIDTALTALQKMDFFSTFNAQALARQGVEPTLGLALQYMAFRPWSRFIRRYVFKGGFLDGWPGFIQAAVSSIDFQVRFIKLWHWARHREELPPLPPPPPGETR